jgi:CheY-like chemotaxis protein
MMLLTRHGNRTLLPREEPHAIVGSFASDAWRYLPVYYELEGTVELKFIASGVVCDIDTPLIHAAGWKVVKPQKGMHMNKDQVQNVGQRAGQPRTGWAGMNSVPGTSRDSGPDRQTPPLHILIVEDELLPATLVEIAVMDAGHVAHKASELSKAMALAAAEPFDAAVLDVNISGEYVFPLAALLRKRAVPFLFASSYGRAGVPREYQDCAVLQKPYGLDEFDSALRALLGEPNHA